MSTPRYGARIAWSDEDAAWIATAAEFPGLSGVAASPEEALHELREAMEMAIATLQQDGAELPVPRAEPVHSGQLRVRMPRSLHSALARCADEEGVSLNTLVVSLLARGLGQAQALRTHWR